MSQQAIFETSPCAQDLKQAHRNFHKNNPRACAGYDAAASNVSEAVRVATGCGETVTRLAANWCHLVQDLEHLGPVTALTRNDHAVHEKTGRYRIVQISGDKASIMDNALELRLLLSHWHYGFAVEENNHSGIRHSLQFFDSDGTAVHKVYLTAKSCLLAYRSLVGAYRASDQSPEQAILAALEVPERPDEDVNTERLRAHWTTKHHTSDFPNLLRIFGISRIQALRLLGLDLASRISPDLFRGFMETVSEIALPIRVIVRSQGAIQTHSGPIHKLRVSGSWFNVLDDEFSLHLNEAAIASHWVVQRPAVVGDITSLELYDAQGQNIALIFGEYNAGEGEDSAWHDLVGALPGAESVA